MNLTPHFTLDEMTYSETALRLGLDNTPNADALAALTRTCEGLERIRALAQRPIFVTSGYRAPAVNLKVGGQANSQHMKGEAADIVCRSLGAPIMLAALVNDNLAALGVDQLILEFGRWTHVSFPPPGRAPRGEVLTIDARGKLRGLNDG